MKSSVVVVSLMVLVLIFTSGCEVYNSLYGGQSSGQEEPVFVPDSEIVTENVSSQAEQDTAVLQDVEQTVDDIAGEVTPDDQPANDTEQPAEQEPGAADESPADESQDTTAEDAQAADELAIIAQETETVSLVPQASDPDGDELIFTFTSPLNENGEWQTTYGDAGEYTVTVTASDGDLTSTQDVLLVIQKREEPPVIGSATPQESAVQLQETESQEFRVQASDLNNDPLVFTWKIDGVPVGDSNTFNYQTTYDDAGSHTVKVDVSDGSTVASRIWSVAVQNLNRLPSLSLGGSFDVQESEPVTIEAQANDEDQDELQFSIDDERFTQEGSTFTWETDYDSAGEYQVTVTVDDGEDTVSKTVTVTVQNVNRKPVILDITQKQ